MSNWLQLLVALCFAEFVHNCYEVWGIKKKISWLDMLDNGLEHGKWPFHINNRFKWALLHLSILVFTTTLGYLTLHFISPSDKTAIITAVVVLLINYICTTWYVDKCHSQVGRLLNKRKSA